MVKTPYPNEHSCRLQDPDKYSEFRREENFQDSGYDVIFGIRTEGGERKSEIQAIRYPKDKWTPEKARSHCGDKGGRFEPATEKIIDWVISKPDGSVDTEFSLHIPILKSLTVDRFIAGYATIFDVPDEVGDIITREFMESTLEAYKNAPVIRWMHDTRNPIGKAVFNDVHLADGHTYRTGIDQHGLFVVAQISKAAEREWQMIEEGIATGFSIGFKTKDNPSRKCNAGKCYTVYGKETGRLYEISVVDVPMHPRSHFKVLKRIERSTQKEGDPMSIVQKQEDEHEAARKRCGKYSVSFKEGKGHLTKPSEYADVDEDQFADPCNFKYPLHNEEKIRAALSYSGKEENRVAGGYNEDEWTWMRNRIKAAAKRIGIEVEEEKKMSEEIVKRLEAIEAEIKTIKESLKPEEIKKSVDALEARVKKIEETPDFKSPASTRKPVGVSGETIVEVLKGMVKTE